MPLNNAILAANPPTEQSLWLWLWTFDSSETCRRTAVLLNKYCIKVHKLRPLAGWRNIAYKGGPCSCPQHILLRHPHIQDNFTISH